MANKTFLTVEEHSTYVEGLSHMVYGKVVQEVELQQDKLVRLEHFEWRVSHRCKPSEGAGVYYPSSVSGDSLEKVRAMLFMYLSPFTTIGVERDERY